jgi:glycosyltransferase involved in cell wall biosynthesis
MPVLPKVLFITPEFPTVTQTAGGLASYLGNVTKLLTSMSWQVDVAVSSSVERITFCDNVRIFEVPVRYPTRSALLKLCNRFPAMKSMFWHRFEPLPGYSMRSFISSLDQCHGYNVIQVSDFQDMALSLSPNLRRKAICRYSSAAGLYAVADGVSNGQQSSDNRVLKLYDLCAHHITPSCVTQNYYRSLGLDLSLVRSPVPDWTSGLDCVPPIPSYKFAIHFGQLLRRKGTDKILRILGQVVDSCPDFKLVVIGHDREAIVGDFMVREPRLARHLIVLAPLTRSLLHPWILSAQFAILPSLIDNLPNTAIESLSLNVPIITTEGNSIDELIHTDCEGLVVASDDDYALAQAIIKTWTSPRLYGPLLPRYTSGLSSAEYYQSLL